MRSTVHQTALYAEVFLDEGIASYGKFVHDGTKPHEIRAKNKQALHFVMGGKSWFVPKRPYIGNKIKNPYWAKLKEQGANISFKGHVNHPGTKPDQFLYNAATAKTDEVLKTINTAIDTAYRKAGV
jgi:hypothetical protein